MSSSLTDTAEWRSFCLAAADDLSLLERDPDGILTQTLGVDKPSADVRYEWVTDLLEQRFGNLGGARIVELGGGYGGQALSVLHRFPSVIYQLVDLPEASRLQRVFLDAHSHYTFSLDGPADLFISSFAISELAHGNQLDALLRYAAPAERGFIWWNGWLNDEVSIEDFLWELPDIDCEDEPDPDDERNRILTWGPRP